MSVKIRKLSLTLKSSMAFLMTSVFFLHIVTALQKGQSAFEWGFALDSAMSYWWLLGLVGVTLRLLSQGSTFSLWPFVICNGIIFLKIFVLFLIDLNKVVLAFDFLFFLTAFASAALLRIELKESLYIPGFTEKDVDCAFSYNLPALIITAENEDGVPAQITRCSRESCFLVPARPLEGPMGSVKIKISYGGKEFSLEGDVHTCFGGGVGVKIQAPGGGTASYSWDDFLEVIDDRGLRVKN